MFCQQVNIFLVLLSLREAGTSRFREVAQSSPAREMTIFLNDLVKREPVNVEPTLSNGEEVIGGESMAPP